MPPNGIAKPVYGFGGFDWDSSIGSPAVQMGLLTYEDGGEVTILIKEGPEHIKYEGWNTTFVYLDAKGNVVKPDESTILFIDIPDEPFQPSRDPAPAYFTVSNQTGTTLSVTNECEYALVELYILTPKMEAELDYSKELLQGSVLASGESVPVKLSRWPYLQSFLETEGLGILSVGAYDEDGYPLFQYWLPDKENLQIVLSDWDYLKGRILT